MFMDHDQNKYLLLMIKIMHIKIKNTNQNKYNKDLNDEQNGDDVSFIHTEIVCYIGIQ